MGERAKKWRTEPTTGRESGRGAQPALGQFPQGPILVMQWNKRLCGQYGTTAVTIVKVSRMHICTPACMRMGM